MTEPWSGDGLGPEDLAIPEVKLIQNVGGDLAKGFGANPGDFYLSLTDEVIPGGRGFDMIIVGIQKSRTYWGRSEIADEPPTCASLDARTMRSIDGQDCSQCQYRNEAPWLLDREERRNKCLTNYSVIGLNYADNMPLLLRATGISAVPTKELYTQLSLNKQLHDGWYKAKTHITGVKKKSTAGDAYAIHFGKLELIEDKALLEEVKIRAHQLLGTSIALPEARPPEEFEPPELAPGITLKEKTPVNIIPTLIKEEQPPPEEKPAEIDTDF